MGIKSTGGFQHSSFMYGATVASAGLLKVSLPIMDREQTSPDGVLLAGPEW